MKASQWIQMIWDTVPEAVKISHGGTSVWVRAEKGKPLISVPRRVLKLDYDMPLHATRPSATERLSVSGRVGDKARVFENGRLITDAPAFSNFMGYELADGTLSPRLGAGMDVRYIVFKKDNNEKI